MKITFIAGKGISTKSIADGNISAHFEVPDNFNANDYINKPLSLILDGWVMMDCSISNEGSSYYYNGTHQSYAIKLDILLPDIVAMGLIFKSEILWLEVFKDSRK